MDPLVWPETKLGQILGAFVKVGDTPSDLLEGNAAGCGMVVGVTSGIHAKELLLPHPHRHLIDSIRDLPGLIASR